MVTARQKSIIDIHTKRKKEAKPNTKDSHQITREENQRRKEKKRPTKTNPKTINKMAIGIYIMVITLNANRLNAPAKRH